MLLGRKTSLERVATFLREMDRRLYGAGVMALPMCRRDIADYLGLTLETVSRTLSLLRGKGILGSLTRGSGRSFCWTARDWWISTCAHGCRRAADQRPARRLRP